MKTITIAPTSRLEGHGKISLMLDDHGKLKDARFHVMEFRGFEKFCQGRKVWEMPRITTRTCGICPISHHLASAKAADDLFEVDIPKAAKLYREMHHMAQTVHSHALHFFYLAAPDFLFPNDEAKRNVLGILAENPELAKQAIALRGSGQKINHILGGKALHPVTSLPGGVSKRLSNSELKDVQKLFKEAVDLSQVALKVAKVIFNKNGDFIKSYANLKTKFLGLVKDGNLELYDGTLRLTDDKAKIIEEFDPKNYLDHIAEKTEDWSWLKFPYAKKFGWPDGIYRVGPLARINLCDQIPTPLANAELKEFRKSFGRAPGQTLLFHYARLIECLHAAERGLEISQDPALMDEHFREKLQIRGGEGVGVIEAPRGTLFHHYKADEKGTITMANMIVATIGNNPAMNMSVKEAAKDYLNTKEITEPMLNKIEMAVRAHDPCLSCSTHAVGNMPLHVKLYDSKGNVISEKVKGQ